MKIKYDLTKKQNWSDNIGKLVILIMIVGISIHLFFFTHLKPDNLHDDIKNNAYTEKNIEIDNYIAQHRDKILNTRTNKNFRLISDSEHFNPRTEKTNDKVFFLDTILEDANYEKLDHSLISYNGIRDIEQTSNLIHVFSFKNDKYPYLYNAASYWNSHQEWAGLYIGFLDNPAHNYVLQQKLIKKFGMPDQIISKSSSFQNKPFYGIARWYKGNIMIEFNSHYHVANLQMTDSHKKESLSLRFIHLKRAQDLNQQL